MASVLFLEFCPTNCRPAGLVVVEGSCWTVGSLLEVAAAWGVLQSSWSISAWRVLLMVSSIPNVVAALSYFWYRTQRPLDWFEAWCLKVGRDTSVLGNHR